ncbi:MAG: SDR family NAD(P)-dependent oxidoreductase [Acidimicrobiales bacterium]
MSNTRLDGKIALVTGGGGGIGEALVVRLAARGAHVVVADVDLDRAAEVAAAVDGSASSFDVADRAAWDLAVADLVAEHGGLDLVALNAGVMSRPKGVDMAGDDPLEWMARRYDLVRSVNLDGVAYGVMATVPHLAAGGGGAISVTSSMAGLVAQPEDPVYSMTKHGVIGLVRSLGSTLAARGIMIGTVCPAGVDTSMVPPDFRAAGYSFAPPDHVAGALETILDSPVGDAGVVWVTMSVDEPIWRYEFAPLR